MRALLRDLRHAWRSLRHRPALTLVAILALTLGIGLTTMMLTIVYGALLRGLPFPDGDRIMIVQRTDPARGIDGEPLPLQDYADFRAQQHSFAALGAFTPGAMFVSGDSGSAQAERVDGSWISANAFDILGAMPFLGRTFRPGEDTPAAERVVIIGWGFPPSDTDTAAQGRFFDQLLDGIATVPGVQAAALSSGLPAADVGLADAAFTVEAQTYANDSDHPVAQTASVTPRLFEVLRTPIVSGRPFTPADRAGSLRWRS